MPLRLLAYLTTALSGIAVGYSFVDPAPPEMIAAQEQTTVSQPPVALPVPPVVARSADQSPPEARWNLREDVSAFDDFTNVYLSVPSDAPLTCGARRRASLMLRCLADKTAIYIAHDCATPPIDPDGWNVDLRLDDAPAQSVQMQVDDRGEAFGHWDYRDARTFIERLEAADRLHVRFTDASGLESVLQFPVTGLTDRVDTLREACHWSDTPPWAIGPQPETPLPESIVNASGPSTAPVTTTDGTGYRLLGERVLEQNARSNPPRP
jgi:hypothetical protein